MAIHLVHSLEDSLEQRLLRDNHEVLTELRNIGSKIMAAFEDLKASVDTYIAAVNAMLSQGQVDVQKLIADAIAADDAGEAVDLQKLKADVDAAFAKLPPPPPPFEPSGNG